MAANRKRLRLIPCQSCGHLRATHYLYRALEGPDRLRTFRPRNRRTPIPCHAFGCGCDRFVGRAPPILCPLCPRVYTTRPSLEVHVYGSHPNLSIRERSLLVTGAVRGRVRLPDALGGLASAPVEPPAA